MMEGIKKRFEKISLLTIARTIEYFLIFALPIFFIPVGFTSLQMSKEIFAGILTFLAFTCYLIYALTSHQLIYSKSRLTLSVLIFLIAAALSTIFCKAFWIAFWGGLTQPDSFFAIFIYTLTFFLATVLFSKKDLPKIGICFFAGWLLVLIFGTFQVFGKFLLPWQFTHQSSFNSIGTPLSWIIFIALGIVLIIALLSTFKFSKKLTFLLAILGLVATTVLVLVNFRIIWIILALTMFLFSGLKFIRQEKITLPVICFVIFVVFIFLSSFLPSWTNLPAEIRANLSHTLSIAKEIWKEKQFLFGSGLSTFIYDYARFPHPGVIQSPLWFLKFTQGYSFLSTLPATMGILGVLSFLFLIFCFLRQSLSEKEKEFLIIETGLGFLFLSLTVYPSFFVEMFFLSLGLGLLNSQFKQELKIDFSPQTQKSKIPGLMAFLGVSFFLAVSLIGIYFIIQKYVAFAYFQKGDFTKATKLDPHSDLYWRSLSQDLLSKTKNTSNLFLIQDTTNSALNAARKATQINPLDALNWANLAKIYENLIPIENADKFAIENYQKALQREPKSPQRFVDLARVLIVSADYSQKSEKEKKLGQAKENLSKALMLKPDYAPAHLLLAQIYLKEGNLEKANEEIEKIKAAYPQDSGWAFQIGVLYYQNNQIDLAQKEFERAVALSPNYSNARYYLGLIYDKKGEREKAIEQFERIRVFNPENEEVKKILENLRKGKRALEGIK